MATNSSILAWRIPWLEEPGGLQSMRSQTVRHNLACTHTGALCLMGDMKEMKHRGAWQAAVHRITHSQT